MLGAASAPAQGGASDGDEDDTQEVRAHQRVLRGRKPLDAALPREVVRHELPESERFCPHDGAVLVEIGVQASEQLDIIPQQVRVIRHERVKYACPCCDGNAFGISTKILPIGNISLSRSLFLLEFTDRFN